MDAVAGESTRGRWIRATIGAAILCIGAVRFIGLDRPVLWHDEVYTRLFVSGRAASDWKPIVFSGTPLPAREVVAVMAPDPAHGVAATWRSLAKDEPQHPPLYYLIARAWLSATGDTIAHLRALSALFGLLAIPAAAAAGRVLFADRRAATAAAAMLAASPFFVLYAQEAREYALWTALTLASTAALVRAQQRGGGWWVVWSVATTLTLYTSLSSAVVIAAHGAFLAATERRVRALVHAVAALAAAGIAFAPWAAEVVAHRDAMRASMAWASDIVIPRTEVLTHLAVSLSRPLIDFWPGVTGPASVVGVLAALTVTGIAMFELRHAPRTAVWMLAALFVAPLVVTALPDLAFGGIRSTSTRYLTPTLLAIALAVAHLALRRPRLFAATLAFALASSLWNAGREVTWTKGISAGLPAIAREIGAVSRPYVIGDMERHHPGSLLALAHRLPPDATMQFLNHGVFPNIPADHDVFLFSPLPQVVDALRTRGYRLDAVYRDPFLALWRVHATGHSPPIRAR